MRIQILHFNIRAWGCGHLLTVYIAYVYTVRGSVISTLESGFTIVRKSCESVS